MDKKNYLRQSCSLNCPPQVTVITITTVKNSDIVQSSANCEGCTATGSTVITIIKVREVASVPGSANYDGCMVIGSTVVTITTIRAFAHVPGSANYDGCMVIGRGGAAAWRCACAAARAWQ